MPQEAMVFACVDGSSISHSVCDYAAWIARVTQSPLRLQYNAEPALKAKSIDLSGSMGLATQSQLLAELAEVEAEHQRLSFAHGRALLDSFKQRVQAQGVEAPVVKLRHGGLTEDLISLEDSLRVLVIGAWGEHEQRVAGRIERLARAMHRPIFVANNTYIEPKQAVLIFDESPAGQKALQWAMESPVYANVDIFLVCFGEETEDFVDAARQLRLANRVVFTASLVTSEPVDALIQFVQQKRCDLVMLGAFRHNRFHDLLFGSFTARVLRKAKVPVLLLR